MNPKHTPGPWKVETYKGEVEVWSQSTFICTTNSTIFRTAHSQFEDNPNAHLIASAPELLLAAEILIEHLREQGLDNQYVRAMAFAVAKAIGGAK